MDESTYLEERVKDQLEWFERKSSRNQKSYKRLKILVLFLSISIPVVIGLLDGIGKDSLIKTIVGIQGVLIAIIEGLLSLNKYHENWMQYRASAEALKREEYLFKTRAGHYQNAVSPFEDFVVQIEHILGEDIQNWQQYVQKESK